MLAATSSQCFGISLSPFGSQERHSVRRQLGRILGNDAIDQKLHDIAGSGPVVLAPDFSKLEVVGLTQELAESCAP